MKSSQLLLCAVATAQIFFSSCKKSNDLTTNSSTSGINYELKTTNTIATINQRTLNPQSGTLTWTSGFGSASLIKFEAKTNSKEVEFKSKSLQRVDLFTAITGRLGSITLPAGNYNEVEFKIVFNKNSSDAALELNGQYSNAGINIPVVFKVDTELELKAEKENVIISDNNSYKALTTIDLSLLTKNITEAMLKNAQLTNRQLVISATSNANIYAIIVSTLNNLHSCEFEHD